MISRVILDFDGTLVDNRVRLYTLFNELVPENNLSFDEYWRIKRRNVTQRTLLKDFFSYPEEKIGLVKQAWLDKVEDYHLLEFDQVFDGVALLLKELSSQKELFLISARQHPDRAIFQLKKLGLLNYFQGVYFTEQKMSKFDVFNQYIKQKKESIVVGDTGDDILFGKKLESNTVAVYSGNLDREVLANYNPTEIVPCITSSTLLWS